MLRQVDVKCAFLYSDLDEERYIRPPPCLCRDRLRQRQATAPETGKVWKLRKALYGLKQAPRAWNETFTKTMQSEGFEVSEHDPCLFRRGQGRSKAYVALHVDDSAILADEEEDKKILQMMKKHYDVKDLGLMHYFLGQEVEDVPGVGLLLKQPEYAKNLLKKAGMWDSKAKQSPMETRHMLSKTTGVELKDDDPRRAAYGETVGALLYLSTHTRPDLAYPVGVLSRFMAKPTDAHFQAMKKVLRYLKGTWDMGLMFKFRPEMHEKGVQAYTEADYKELGISRGDALKLYSDADLAGDLDGRKSTSGMMLTMNGCPVLWGSKLQTVVATSTSEAEYISAAMAVKEALWVRKLLSDFNDVVERMVVYCDNQSALCLMKQRSAITPGRSKHIDIQYHFITNRYLRQEIDVRFVPTDEQRADMLTKALAAPALRKAVAGYLMRSPSDSA